MATSGFFFQGDHNADASCTLRNGADVIGAAADRRLITEGDSPKRSLTMNGGALVPSGGGELSVWCASQGPDAVDTAQVMIMQVGGFA
jgi:hypothetical protein